jgi:hypothetical protein
MDFSLTFERTLKDNRHHVFVSRSLYTSNTVTTSAEVEA